MTESKEHNTLVPVSWVCNEWNRDLYAELEEILLANPHYFSPCPSKDRWNTCFHMPLNHLQRSNYSQHRTILSTVIITQMWLITNLIESCQQLVAIKKEPGLGYTGKQELLLLLLLLLQIYGERVKEREAFPIWTSHSRVRNYSTHATTHFSNTQAIISNTVEMRGSDKWIFFYPPLPIYHMRNQSLDLCPSTRTGISEQITRNNWKQPCLPSQHALCIHEIW